MFFFSFGAWIDVVAQEVTAKKNGESGEKEQQQQQQYNHYCCKAFLQSLSSRKIIEQASSFTADKYYCVVDGFGYSILKNILYCPYCGNNLVGHHVAQPSLQ